MKFQRTRTLRFARSFRFGVFALSFGIAAGCASTKTATPESEADAQAALAAPREIEQGPALVDRLLAHAARDNQVQEHLRALCFDIGPRLTSSHNLERAEQWAIQQFNEWGLDAHLEEWGEFPVGFDRGPRRGGIVAPEVVDFDFTTMAWLPGTNGPRRGKAILRPETEEELAAVADQLPGAWIVRKSAPRTRRGPPGGGDPAAGGGPPAAGGVVVVAGGSGADAAGAAAPPAGEPTAGAAPAGGASAEAGAGGRSSGGNAREAEERGPSRELREKIDAAIAAAGIAGEVRRGFGGRPDRVITDGNYRISWDKLPTEVRVTLRGDQFDDLLKRIEAKEAVELEFDVDNRFYQGPVKQYNVIADLRGTERPDEIVMVGGHLDSWDGAQGAVDNGTGVATTMEAARLLSVSGARPKRTIRFALWSGEEQGLFGSAGYVKSHADDLDKISAVLIHDGGTNYLSGIGVTPEMEPAMRAACAPILHLDEDMPFEIRVTEGLMNSGDSDHASFLAKGVPGFFWDQDGKSDYNHMHHTQYDTFDTAVPEYQRHSAVVAAVVAYNLANQDALLDRANMESIPPRRMSVQLEANKVTSVSRGGKAAAAGWQEGDVVTSIDGVAVATEMAIRNELQKGGPRKVAMIKRGDQMVETVLDYSGSKDEERREARRLAREGKAPSAKKSGLDLSKFR